MNYFTKWRAMLWIGIVLCETWALVCISQRAFEAWLPQACALWLGSRKVPGLCWLYTFINMGTTGTSALFLQFFPMRRLRYKINNESARASVLSPLGSCFHFQKSYIAPDALPLSKYNPHLSLYLALAPTFSLSLTLSFYTRSEITLC